MKDQRQKPTVFLMDLLATVPYYTAYLAKALLADGVRLKVGSISYYLDPACFSSRAVPLSPGLMDVVGRFCLPRTPRRILKVIETVLNMLALSARFLVRPPSIVHVQYLPMLLWHVPLDLWFLRLWRMRGSCVLLTVHDLLPHNTTDEHRLAFRHLYMWVDAIICHSEPVRLRLQQEFSMAPEKISVIPHGPFFYDLPRTGSEKIVRKLGIPPERSFFLWQGIISAYKGVDLLLEAWRSLEAAAPDTYLVVVGTGPEPLLNELRKKAHTLKLKNVRFDLRFIATKELVALYRAADAVIYPYRAITTSGALATGLALGKTIVASDLPVFSELLTHNENSLLVPAGDTSALADALIIVAKDRYLRERLAAKVAAMNFGEQTWLSIAAQTTHVYDELLRAKPTRLESSDARGK